MTAVFVHGVPETPSIWEPLIAVLDVDAEHSLRLPGFGCDLPDGFEPTMHRYAAWLADTVAALDGPVDLVTHDWGAILAVRVLADRPSNVRSWVTDGSDLTDEFRWHDAALTMQTPGEGEALVASLVEPDEAERAALLVATGVPEAAAAELAGPIDKTMGDAILALYRSATDLGAEWGPGLDDIEVPALVVEATADPFRRAGLAGALADRVGGRLACLPGRGHWWMLEDPVTAGEEITAFWAGLPPP